ncbi:MAG: topoisomerase DNA-binding C4 zinc finger domain-containing protein, partial [Campylobacter sp.]|nr:topoisomerase DNA-binding C4 zinc finger domain-containing protein [Campylobacter sp.]
FGEFIACSGFPKCKYSRNIDGEQNSSQSTKKQAASTGITCPKCQKGEVVERSSKRGKFYGCSLYPKCDYTSNYKPAGVSCPECGEPMVLKELKKGNFHECLACKYKTQIS